MKVSYYIYTIDNYVAQVSVNPSKALFISYRRHPAESNSPEELEKIVAIWKRSAVQNKSK